MDHIYALPSNEKMVIRTNLRLGDDDPLQWPQAYVQTFPHYGCIPCRPSDLEIKNGHYSAILYHLPRNIDFEALYGSAVTGLGFLSREILSKLQEIAGVLRQKLAKHQSSVNDLCPPPIFSTLLAVIDRQLRCLQGIPMTQRQVFFVFVEAQRYMLELIAAYRYQYIYRLRMNDSNQEPPTEIAHSVGVFTRELRVADDFYRAGVPVWLIRPASSAGLVRVDSLVDIIYPADIGICLTDNPHRFPTTFKGPYGHPDKYTRFGQYSLSFVKYPDPFNRQVSVTSLVASSPAPTSMLSSSTLTVPGVVRTATPRTHQISRPCRCCFSNSMTSKLNVYGVLDSKPSQKSPAKNRDKFSKSQNPLMLLPLLAWSSALENVNRESFKRPADSKVSDGGYVFPDPALLVGPATPEKQARFIFTWLRFRHVLIYRLVSSRSTAEPIGSQLWRNILNLPVNEASKSSENTKNSQRDDLVKQLLQDCLDDDVGLNFLPLDRVLWGVTKITVDNLPDKHVIHEILWELSELNFRYEFSALNCRARLNATSGPVNDIDEQWDIIRKCFPEDTKSILVADVQNAWKGLAAARWQDRMPFVFEMHAVMKTWIRYSTCGLGSVKEHGLCEEEFLLLEELVAKFYTQSFYDFFGRAAILPCSLARPSQSH